MKELPMDTIKDIFDVMVVVDSENYVLVINLNDNKLGNEALKKVTDVNPLLKGSCIAKSKTSEMLNWNIAMVN